MGKIIVTSGGTTEQIDSVRGITNFSGGELGKLIAEDLVFDHTVFYIHGKKAAKPLSRKVDNPILEIPCTDTESVWNAIQKVMSEHEIDWIIHAMAVSDYTVETMVDLDQIVDLIYAKSFMLYHPLDETEIVDDSLAIKVLDVMELLQNPPMSDKNGKRSSSIKRPLLYLKPTPKLVQRFKQEWPKTKLCSFKLLSGVSEEDLLSTAIAAGRKCGADLVVANDLSNITKTSHKAFIIDNLGQTKTNTTIAYTKAGIAKEIVRKIAENI